MRTLFIDTLAALSLGVVLAGSVAASAQASAPHRKVFGYQDNVTGAFHPLNRVVADTATPPTTGEIELTITITLKTPVPTGGFVLCDTDIEASSESLNTTTEATSVVAYAEHATAEAKVTGSTATCTVNTPYSWAFPAASATTKIEDQLTGSYTVTIYPAPSNVLSETLLQGRSSASTFLSSEKIPTGSTPSLFTAKVTL